MTPLYARNGVTLFHGDCLKVLPCLLGRVDSVVTDPPYELGFMGKKWDGTGIANSVELWREVLRVLKPGGHLLACGGTRTYHRMACAIENAGFEIRDSLHWIYGTGFPKSLNVGKGIGTALKPGHEPIVLARKPLVGTVAENVAAYGTGGLNVDACRIPMQDGESLTTPQSDPAKRGGASYGFRDGSAEKMQAAQRASIQRTNESGRWPANVLLDEDAAAELDAQSGIQKSGIAVRRHTGHSDKGIFPIPNRGPEPDVGYGDTGGASRFFYVAKASRAERDLVGRNGHPTVKPVELMRHLVRLITPPGGTVLDPFMGSGTTGYAAWLEEFDFVGIDAELQYVELAQRRSQARPAQRTLGNFAAVQP